MPLPKANRDPFFRALVSTSNSIRPALGGISPFYDSLLVKVTCRGQTHEQTCRRLSRALKEFHSGVVAPFCQRPHCECVLFCVFVLLTSPVWISDCSLSVICHKTADVSCHGSVWVWSLCQGNFFRG
eukprot:EG_transcript_32893